MKRKLIILATAVIFSLTSSNLIAQYGPNPGNCPNCPTGGTPKKDGTGPGAKNGKRSGPQDGSGPIHTPPNGGQRGGGGRR
jgi:hypothetical protein